MGSQKDEDWRQALAAEGSKGGGKGGYDGPVDLFIVVSSGRPWGFAFHKEQVSNRDADTPQTRLLKRMKSIKSPRDGSFMFKWMYGWLWMCLFGGSVTLSQYLETDEWIDISNEDPPLIRSVQYRKESITGQLISEAEAVAMSELFDPTAPPPTVQAPKVCKTFSDQAEMPGPSASGSKRPCRYKARANSAKRQRQKLSGPVAVPALPTLT